MQPICRAAPRETAAHPNAELKANLSIYSQEQLNAIAEQLNNRLRVVHGFYPPIVVFQPMLDKLNQPSSSIQQTGVAPGA